MEQSDLILGNGGLLIQKILITFILFLMNWSFIPVYAEDNAFISPRDNHISETIEDGNHHADHIVLKNGDRITGEIISMEENTLKVKNFYAGEVTIHWKDVASVISQTPLSVETTFRTTRHRVDLTGKYAFSHADGMDTANSETTIRTAARL